MLYPFNAYSIGNMPATNATYNLRRFKHIMIPLNRSDITMAGQVGDEIGVLGCYELLGQY